MFYVGFNVDSMVCEGYSCLNCCLFVGFVRIRWLGIAVISAINLYVTCVCVIGLSVRVGFIVLTVFHINMRRGWFEEK